MARIAEQIQQEKNKYLILLIITDGVIHDMDETIRMIVRGADAPLSILIVGVGNEDFSNMEVAKNGHLRYRFLMEMMNVFLMMERLLLVILYSLSQQERW